MNTPPHGLAANAVSIGLYARGLISPSTHSFSETYINSKAASFPEFPKFPVFPINSAHPHFRKERLRFTNFTAPENEEHSETSLNSTAPGLSHLSHLSCKKMHHRFGINPPAWASMKIRAASRDSRNSQNTRIPRRTPLFLSLFSSLKTDWMFVYWLRVSGFHSGLRDSR